MHRACELLKASWLVERGFGAAAACGFGGSDAATACREILIYVFCFPNVASNDQHSSPPKRVLVQYNL